jgi:iron complex transport system substrate-binding protein
MLPSTPSGASSLFPLTITDSRGRDMVLESAPLRMVLLDAAGVEMLFAMGHQGKIVATHDFVDYPPDTVNIETIGSAFALNMEHIVDLDSDLVYTFFESPVSGLEALGLNVLYLEEPTTLEGIAERIRLWGKIVGDPRAAELVAVDYETRLAALEFKLGDVVNGPRVWHDLGDFFTVGKDSLIDHVYSRLGAYNIAGKTEGFPQLSPEVIVDRDPEVIITIDPDYSEHILGNPGLSQVSAVKNGRVLEVSGGFLTIAGPRMIDWTETLATLLYPDIF